MNLEISGIVIAITQAIKLAIPEKVSGIVTIIVAALVGLALAAYSRTDLIQGVFDGLVAAGIITTVKAVGK